MKTNTIREKFLHYFKSLDHTVVPSASLVPGNDPTLLFTNAGMVPFKDVFLGVEKRSYTRATSSQRCVRAGGKHNDLENVGYTARHHTFFEMLGNFSFGDYFKREAIEFAWDFLTKELNIPHEKLWVTVYKDDDEAADIWHKDIGLSLDRIIRCGEKSNFWSMGDTGPCGPCTEIFYDHGKHVPGGKPGEPDEDGDRYIEIWNLVFMQFNRDIHGTLTPLPKPCVDTGMGLERIAAVMQGVHNNYEIDLFQHILQALTHIVGIADTTHASMRVIADHIRSCSFLIMDGVTPSNEGRGYVLRRIIRRALRHGYSLGMREPFFYKLVPALCDEMGDAYPELREQRMIIEEALKREEQQFIKTLEHGIKIYDEHVSKLKGTQLPGDLVFLLYDTYGFPADLTADMAREAGLTVDEEGFNKAMQHQREQSQGASRFKVDQTSYLHLPGETEFFGYQSLAGEGEIQTLLVDDNPVAHISKGDVAVIVLNRSPFYAESGGQIGDRGYITKQGARFRVDDTQKKGRVILHWGTMLEGEFNNHDKIHSQVDDSRQAIRLNHSATHLMHDALRHVLGKHVTQKGSLVDAKRLRFDFSHTSAMTSAQIHEVEHRVNQAIRDNVPVALQEQSLEEAKASGAMALFGEKYAERVRVITMGQHSSEICGGTHVERTGDIGFFKIISESACSAGVRRIEAVTGVEALKWAETMEAQLQAISNELRIPAEESVNKIQQLMLQIKDSKRELAKLQQQVSSGQAGSLLDHVTQVGRIAVLAINVPNIDRDALRTQLDQLKSHLTSAALVLATVKDGKAIVIAGVSKDCLSHFTAVDLLNHVTGQIDGKGGGRPDLAQGGGENPAKLDAALASVVGFVREKV